MLFDIYDHISKLSYPSLMRVFLNHIKIQLKEKKPLIYNKISDFIQKKKISIGFWREK